MTVKSNYKLDARIESIDDIQTILRYDVNCIGCKGYFFDDLWQAKDLNNHRYGKLVDIVIENNSDLCFKAELESGFTNYFRFFIPESDLKPVEKKYRPYTVMEFIKEYPLGSHLHFRPKYKTMEMHRLIDGYNDCLNGSGTLFLCGVLFSMLELYDNYEIFKDGEWKPFGVLDEEKE